jgi:uncharacterized protein (DUF1330 family)
MYEGNRRFRDLVSERKDEYISAVKHEKKQKIANELVNTIHASGGRFLCLSYDGRTTEGSNIVDSGTWIEAEYKAALEKCKQSLREKRKLTKKRPALAIEAVTVVDEEANFIFSDIVQDDVDWSKARPIDHSGSVDMLANSAETDPVSLLMKKGTVQTLSHPLTLSPDHNVPLHIMQQPQWGIDPYQHPFSVYHEEIMSPILNDQSTLARTAFSLNQMTQTNDSLLSPLEESSTMETSFFEGDRSRRTTAEMQNKPGHWSVPSTNGDREDLRSTRILFQQDGEDLNEAFIDWNVSEFLLSML